MTLPAPRSTLSAHRADTPSMSAAAAPCRSGPSSPAAPGDPPGGLLDRLRNCVCHAPRGAGAARIRHSQLHDITSTARPISRLTRVCTSSINSSRPFQSPPLKIRRLIFAENGVINPITLLCLLNSIANRHRAVSTCIAAGRLITVRTVIRLSYALVVGLHERYRPVRRACIGSLPDRRHEGANAVRA